MGKLRPQAEEDQSSETGPGMVRWGAEGEALAQQRSFSGKIKDIARNSRHRLGLRSEGKVRYDWRGLWVWMGSGCGHVEQGTGPVWQWGSPSQG